MNKLVLKVYGVMDEESGGSRISNKAEVPKMMNYENLCREYLEGEWRRLHNEELHSLYRSPNIRVVRVVKSRILRSAGHIASMEEGRSSFKILTDIHTETRLVGVYERTILKWI